MTISELFKMDILVDSAGQPQLWALAAATAVVSVLLTHVVQRWAVRRSIGLVRADVLQLTARIETLESREQARFLHALHSSAAVRPETGENQRRLASKQPTR